MSSGQATDVLKIEGKFYDTKGLAAIHPGGELWVRLSNNTDATAMFNTSHRRRFPHDKYKQYEVPASKVPKGLIEEMDRDFTLFWEVCDKIKPVIGNTSGFAPWTYWIKVFVILAVTFYLDFRAIFVGPVIILSFVQGLFMGFIGLNLQHDANHGAVSKNPTVNRLLGLTQDYLGGVALMWMTNHNVVHHVHCNDADRDRDLQIPLLRLHNKVRWNSLYVVQQLYFTLLEAAFGLVHVFFNLYLIWRGPTKSQEILADYWNTHKLMSFIFPVRVLACLFMQGWAAVPHLAIVYSFGGAYLAFFFLMSHNFDGVEKTFDSTKGCFVKLQAETSSNVGGWLLAQFNGGLNYQIEHHLFPRIHHSLYPYMAPVVREICERNSIKYVHFPTVLDNAKSTYNHLLKMGQKPKVAV